MTLRSINIKSLITSGFIAGYLMYFADHYLKGTLGLFGLFPGTSSPWWMLEHHIDAILFAIPFALPAIYRALPGPRWVKGWVYGMAFWLVTSLIKLGAGALGATAFAGKPMTVSVSLSLFLLHSLYGFVLGALYLPPRESLKVSE